MKRNGFTIVEILIVVAIIAILAGVGLMTNINNNFKRARDSNRKTDLNKLARSFEDYYNDHGQYPPVNDPPDGKIKDASWGSTLSGYVNQLPKDPLSPNLDYYYQLGPNGKFFVLYTKLEITADPDIERVGCQEGCGPTAPDGKRFYNFLVSSSDVVVAEGIPNGTDPGPMIGAPTTTPSFLSPTPTLNLTPPATPDGICGHNQCCLNHWCGAGSTVEGGKYCAQTEKCYFNLAFTWVCACANISCSNPNPACP